MVMVFNATSVLSWLSASLVEELHVQRLVTHGRLLYGVLTPLSTIYQFYRGGQFYGRIGGEGDMRIVYYSLFRSNLVKIRRLLP